MSTPTNQPRQPAGNPQGGQFASNPGGEEGPDLTGDLEFGPNTAAVQAILDRATQLTPDEENRMGAPKTPYWHTVVDVAWGTARGTGRRDALRAAVWDAPGATGWETTTTVWGAALAELVRGRISEHHYDMLMIPWRVVVGHATTEQPKHLGTRPARSIPATDLKPGDVLADGEFFHHEQVLTVHRSGGVTVVTTTGSEENFAGPYRFQPNDTISICNT